MTIRVAGTVLALMVLCAAPSSAATIFTFGISGTTAFDTEAIHSFSFTPLGAGGEMTFIKEIDSTTDDIALAVASGTTFFTATLVAYEDAIAPAAELFRYVLADDVRFTSQSLGGGGVIPFETVSLFANTVTRTDGPASAPEPGTVLMLAGGLAVLLQRVRRRV